jgi:phosphoglycolate phosphatase
VTKRPTALVFDLDGTLVDSRRDIAVALNRTLRAAGERELPLSEVLAMVGDGSRALVARAFGLETADARVDAPLEAFMREYAARPCVHTVLLPGAREALEAGIPTAVVTNKPREITRLVLDALGIASALGAVRGGGDGPLKPDPAMLLSALAELGVAPRGAWFVGDGPQDVLAGKAAGCFTVLVPGIGAHARALEAGPDLVVETLEDLLPALARAL